jgi:cell division protease FtsH
MGHALVARALPGTDPVHKVSIIPRGIGALGYTIQRPIEDRFLMSRAELENKMAVLLGGRAAEILIFSEVTTGAVDDLAKASNIARSMVTRYGMSDHLGQMTYEEQRQSFLGQAQFMAQERQYSEETAREIDCAVRALTETARQKALHILQAFRKELEAGAAWLLEKETLLEDELPKLDLTQLKSAENLNGSQALGEDLPSHPTNMAPA